MISPLSPKESSALTPHQPPPRARSYQDKKNSPVNCGKGVLGNNDGSKESTEYLGMKIE